jgi:hypothetical protein
VDGGGSALPLDALNGIFIIWIVGLDSFESQEVVYGRNYSLLESLLGFWGLCALGKLPLIVIVFK